MKRYLIVRPDGITLGSNDSFEGAAHTAMIMADTRDPEDLALDEEGDAFNAADMVAVLDSKTALVLARFGACP